MRFAAPVGYVAPLLVRLLSSLHHPRAGENSADLERAVYRGLGLAEQIGNVGQQEHRARRRPLGLLGPELGGHAFAEGQSYLAVAGGPDQDGSELGPGAAGGLALAREGASSAACLP